jgi:hypothetical protein
VQLGVTVTPDTVAVGDPFVVRVRIRAPRGAVVEFPLAPDSGSRVELIDPRAVQRGADSGAVDVTALYRAAAWDVGVRPLGLADAVVRVGTAERRVPLGGARVVVRSVLPADTAAPRDPKPPRALFEPEVPWWRRWLPYILAALALAALLAWLWRRRSRRAPDDAADALAEAEAGFARVERLGLLEAGERGRYVALVVEVLRDYLARRVVGAPVSLTSTELLDALRGSDAVPGRAPRPAARGGRPGEVRPDADHRRAGVRDRGGRAHRGARDRGRGAAARGGAAGGGARGAAAAAGHHEAGGRATRAGRMSGLLGGLEFGTPWALLGLLLLPLWWYLRRRRRGDAIAFSRAGVLATGRAPAGGSRARSLAARALALVVLVIALARPRAGASEEEVSSAGVNIVVAFDISSSMLAEDFQPRNRLEVARERIKEFVAMRRTDRVGLVAFSGEALTQVPLTNDHAVVQAAVDNLQPGQLDDGTAIGTAITTAATGCAPRPARRA